MAATIFLFLFSIRKRLQKNCSLKIEFLGGYIGAEFLFVKRHILAAS